MLKYIVSALIISAGFFASTSSIAGPLPGPPGLDQQYTCFVNADYAEDSFGDYADCLNIGDTDSATINTLVAIYHVVCSPVAGCSFTVEQRDPFPDRKIEP